MPSDTANETGVPDAAEAPPVYQIVYASAATRPMSEDELAAMLAKARPRNERRGITGTLLYHDQSFIQVLEGEQRVVENLFNRIRWDPRHDEIMLLYRGEAEGRSFEDWSMGYVSVNAADAGAMPGFSDFLQRRRAGSLRRGDDAVKRILNGFRAGQWHRHLAA